MTLLGLLALWLVAAIVVALLVGAACGPADLDDEPTDWTSLS